MSAHCSEEILPFFHWHLRVYFEDTDSGGIVYYANYLRFMERARSEWLRSLGVVQSQLLQQNIAFAVRSAHAEFLRPAILDDELLVVSHIENLRTAQFFMRQTLLRAEQVLVEGRVRIACIDIARKRPIAIPEWIMDKLGGKRW